MRGDGCPKQGQTDLGLTGATGLRDNNAMWIHCGGNVIDVFRWGCAEKVLVRYSGPVGTSRDQPGPETVSVSGP